MRWRQDLYQAEVFTALFQPVNAVDLLHHVDGVDFDQLFAVKGQLVIGVFRGDFGFGVFTLFCFAEIKRLMLTAYLNLYRDFLAGIVALVRTGKAQGNVRRTPLREYQLINTANAPLNIERVIFQTVIRSGQASCLTGDGAAKMIALK